MASNGIARAWAQGYSGSANPYPREFLALKVRIRLVHTDGSSSLRGSSRAWHVHGPLIHGILNSMPP